MRPELTPRSSAFLASWLLFLACSKQSYPLGQAAFGHVKYLSQTIGTRPAGTQHEIEASDYIARQFQSAGYRVELQPFEFETFEERRVFVETAGGRKQAHIIGISGQRAVTENVAGSLVVAGIGRMQDFPAGGIAGKIAVIERGTLPLQQKIANAAAAGAVAAIIYNDSSGPFFGWTRSPARIPAVSVSRNDGKALLRAVNPRKGVADLFRHREDATVEARVVADAGMRTIRSQNVIARGADECKVVVGGHYDSVPDGPGANDNATGTAVTIEVARGLRTQARQRGLCFVAFGAEEMGIRGSRRYVASLSDEQKRGIAGMVNLDMVGVGGRWKLWGTESMRAVSVDAARSADVRLRGYVASGRGGDSDQVSFAEAGIPAVFIHRLQDPNRHTSEDKVKYVDPASLEAAARLTQEIVGRLDWRRAFPGSPLPPNSPIRMKIRRLPIDEAQRTETAAHK